MANKILKNRPTIILWTCIIISIKFLEANSHARLIEPPSRSSMWRFGFKTPRNYDDDGLNCGNVHQSEAIENTKCGICGDLWSAPQPRPNEAGGRYGLGIIVRNYTTGSTIKIIIQVTKSHWGFFEFRLCPSNDPKREVTQECLDKLLLERATTRKNDEKFHKTRYGPITQEMTYEMNYSLPQNLTCTQCVLQWRYFAGNDWGYCSDGSGQLGCGFQEEFRSCADISIQSANGTTSNKSYQESITKKPHNRTKMNKEFVSAERKIPNFIPKQSTSAKPKPVQPSTCEGGTCKNFLAFSFSIR